MVEALAVRDARIRELKQTIARQAALIAELERRLGLNSTNRSKLPSSDGLTKPPAPKRTPVKGHKPGGQKGHKGTMRLRSEKPDHVEDHFPHACAHCGHALDDGMSVRFETRQVQDIPEPLPLRVVDHRAHVGICPQCNGETKASFPEGVGAPVQYGPNLTGLVLDLNTHQLLPLKRLVETFRDLFGVKLSPGTVVNMVSRRARAYGGMVDTIRTDVVQARVKHMDETWLRIEGRLHWLHVAGHGLCCAHILRELEGLFQCGREKWAWNLARGRHLSPATMRTIAESYDRIVEEGFRYHESLSPLPSHGRRGRTKRRKGYNLLLRLREHCGSILLFTRNPQVPATNNMANADKFIMPTLESVTPSPGILRFNLSA